MSMTASEYGLYLQTFCEAHHSPSVDRVPGNVTRGEHLREAAIVALAISDASRKAPLRRASELAHELSALCYFEENASAEEKP